MNKKKVYGIAGLVAIVLVLAGAVVTLSGVATSSKPDHTWREAAQALDAAIEPAAAQQNVTVTKITCSGIDANGQPAPTGKKFVCAVGLAASTGQSECDRFIFDYPPGAKEVDLQKAQVGAIDPKFCQ